MTVYCTISLFLWYFGLLSVLYQIAVADQTGPPFFKCIPEMCWHDTNGSGTIADEPLANHITPDTAILINSINFPGSRNGDIVLNGEQYRSRLSSAVLGTTILRKSDGTFLRYIKDPIDVQELGYMQVERPVPDPDTTFGSLGQDPLLANTPESLRSAVDPELLLPSSNESCDIIPSKCLVSVASVDVFYFGPDPTNTACLSTITSPPPIPTPPQVAMDPSSVYVVYQPPQMFDECRRMLVGITGPPVTMSYLPNMMSTLEFRSDGPPATKAMDFADLPCPPSDVAQAYKPGVPYFPVLVSTFGARWSPGTSGPTGLVVAPICDIAAIRDPPVRAHRVGKISGRKGGGGGIP